MIMGILAACVRRRIQDLRKGGSSCEGPEGCWTISQCPGFMASAIQASLACLYADIITHQVDIRNLLPGRE